MKPSQPTNDLARPWADGGDKTIIPESEASAPGRATLEEGFPYVTQLPVNSGGVAPNRTDFNGILYLLSALNFWQQSGGQASWKSSLSYVSPAIVYHNSNYWVAVAESGPDTSAGAVTPGTDETYWQELLAWLAANSSNSGLVGAGNTVKLTGDTTGTGTFGADGNVTVDTTTAVATALRTGRNISLTGDASGSLNYNFDGTRDVSLSATVSKADAWRSNMTLSLGNDASGSVSFNGSSNATLNATVNTATQLRTARDIILSGDVTGSISGTKFNGTGDVTITTKLASSSEAETAFPDWKSVSSRTVGKSYTETSNGYLVVNVAPNSNDTAGILMTIGNWSKQILQRENYGYLTDTCVFPVKAGVEWSSAECGVSNQTDVYRTGKTTIYFVKA